MKERKGNIKGAGEDDKDYEVDNEENGMEEEEEDQNARKKTAKAQIKQQPEKQTHL